MHIVLFHKMHTLFSVLIQVWPGCTTRKPCYRKDDCAMHPTYGRPQKFRESLATPTATSPEIVNGQLL